MKKKTFLFFLLTIVLFGACNSLYNNNDNSRNKPPLFENLITTDDGSVAYYGLTPGISTVDDVVLAMNETGLMKQDVEEIPFIGHTGSGQIVYSYGLVPEAKHYVEFTFTNENYLDLMNIVVSDTHVGELIDVYGEPTSVLFFVIKRFTKESCGMMMFYDEYNFRVSSGMRYKSGKCILSEDETIGDIQIYSDLAYVNYKDEFLTQWEMEIPGTLDDYLSPWKGYGDMIELYPAYLLLEKE